MAYTIELRRRATALHPELNRPIWRLTRLMTEDFRAGLAYGLLYGISEVDHRAFHINIISENGIITRMGTINDAINEFTRPFYADMKITDIDRGAFVADMNNYGFYIRSVDPERAYMVRAELEFLQGLFTGLTACNIPYERVLLSKPYKQGVYYNVVGLPQLLL